MTRLSSKIVINKAQPEGTSLPADFFLPEINATVRDKGLWVIYEKAYRCPCKSDENSSPLSTCRNCGGSGWIFANPMRTKMLVMGITADNKLKEAALREWGNVDYGVVKLTALDDEKLSFMDRITVLDTTAEHTQVLYPRFNDDEDQVFAFAHYDVLSVDFLGLFVDPETQLTRLTEAANEFTFVDNMLVFPDLALDRKQLTVRFRHRPVYHVADVLRESMSSTTGQFGGQRTLIMPVHALAKKAHLVKDAEDFSGTRLLDNSWLTNTSCVAEELTKFQRQLRYSTVVEILAVLTEQQKADLLLALGDDAVLDEDGAHIILE